MIIKKIIVVLLLILFNFNSLFAMSNKYCDITLNDNYKLTIEREGLYQWVNSTEGSNYVLSVKLKQDGSSKVLSSEEQKNNIVNDIVYTLQKQYYDNYKKEIKVDTVSIENADFGKYNSLKIKLKIDDFLKTGKNMNQYIDVIESDKYIYTIFYSTTEEEYNENEYKEIQKSFEIKDTIAKFDWLIIVKYTAIALILVILGFVISEFKRKINIRKGKKV